MAVIQVYCPTCSDDNVVKYGMTEQGKQRYYCKNTRCDKKIFLLDYHNKAWAPGVKEKIINMAMNGSGIRDTSRVLDIHRDTITSTLKKANQLENVNRKFLEEHNPEKLNVCLNAANLGAEMDELWSFVANKKNQRWLWHAIDHVSGKTLAYIFGRRKDKAILQLKKLLKPFGIKKYYTDYWGAYTRHIPAKYHIPGKRNTQKIENKHINLRTRIKRLTRKTICFSKTNIMHDTVIGLFINRYEFGLSI